MKKLLFIMTLYAFNSFAYTDYDCTVRNYSVQLTIDGKSSHVWLMDSWSRELYAQNYVSWIEKKEGEVIMHFFGFEGPLNVYFKPSVFEALPSKLSAWIEARAKGFPIWDQLTCQKL